MARGFPCTWMRGDTSKGAYFLKEDLPTDEAERNALLLTIMGSPDPRQIDGISGYETRAELDANTVLKAKLESIRLQVGALMNLGDVNEKSVPKMTMVAPLRNGGAITTRTFIPHRCHASIGVLGAVSVATACMLPGSPAAQLAQAPQRRGKTDFGRASYR